MPTPPNLTPPAGNSRSTSPSGDQPKPRIVSGSLRDRIARFENPAAAPLLPTHPFGTSGPNHPSSVAQRGLVGNRIPSLDPKSTGMFGSSINSGSRKVSDSKGLIGNRIPSGVSPTTKAASSGRSASPSGSIGSSSASGAYPSSGSPITSRASSPPSSPGLGNVQIPSGFPSGLLAATEPDNGGPGAMTPSSTRAEAGDEASTLSVPSTPVQGAVGATSGHYDLVPPNLKLASGESIMPNPAQIALTRGLSTQSNAGSIVPPSLGSSRASQYDPSSTGDENPEKMMRDVSGISTPHSTPKADMKDLDETDLKERLQGLSVEDTEVDRDPTPEPPSPDIGQGGFVKATEVDGIVTIDDTPEAVTKENEEAVEDEPTGDHYKNTEGVNPEDPLKEQTIPAGGQSQAQSYGGKTHPNDLADPSAPSADDTEDAIPATTPMDVDDVLGRELDEDPNKASDLDDLKSGKLDRQKSPSGVHSNDQNPLNNIAEAGLAQGIDEPVVPADELKEQGGVAGQRMEDIEEPTSIEPPKSQAEEYTNDDDMDVHTATATSGSQSQVTSGDSASTAQPKQLTEMMPDVVEGKEAAGIPLDVAEHGGSGPMTSGDTDKLKDLLNEKRLEEHADKVEQQEEGGKGKDDFEQLQTEEDRDEGAPRKDVLVRALDQNKDTEADLQEETNEAQRAKAREVTANMTEKLRGDDQKDMDAADAEEELLEKEKEEGQGEEKKVVDLKNSGTNDLFGGTEALTSIEAASTGNEEKPTQVQIEPAPVAQPPEEAIVDDDTPTEQAEHEHSLGNRSESPTIPASPPAFPSPPQDDPDVLDPPKTATDTPAEPAEPPVATTPIDSTFLKAFPDVPDEDKPRVQVHVSQSPASSPLKSAQKHADPETPAKSKVKPESLNLPSGETDDKGDSSPEKEERRESLDVDQTPIGGQAKLIKRLSTRKSPKSPLLDDEDPGDFEAGEGWAVVTKGREAK